MFCTECGTKNEPDSKFCASCGTAITTTKISKPTLPGVSKKNILIIGVLAVVICAALFFWPSRSIVGTWELIGIEGVSGAEFQAQVNYRGALEMEIQRNGNIIWRQEGHTIESTSYRIQGQYLLVNDGWGGQSLHFRISGNRLYLGDESETMVFRRK